MAPPKISKSKLLQISQALLERYGPCKPRESGDFVEVLVYQILEMGTSDRAARDALKRIEEEYVDWNEMRVATVREIQDILGPRYDRSRQRAEDLHSLLADLYTAFRKMELDQVICTPEGLETLRALPDTTLIRADMVERALVLYFDVRTFPCDDEQFEVLQYLGGVPRKAEFEETVPAVAEILEKDELLDLHRGLREHTDYLLKHRQYEPRPIDWTPEQERAARREAETTKQKTTKQAKKSTTKKKTTKQAAKQSSARKQAQPGGGSKESTARKTTTKQAGAGGAARKSTTKKATARKSTTKKTSAGKSARKPTTKKKTTAKKNTKAAGKSTKTAKKKSRTAGAAKKK